MREGLSPGPTPDDALTRSRAATRRVWLAGVTCGALAGVWAFCAPTPTLPQAAARGSRTPWAEPPPPVLDVGAFYAPVWTVAEPVKVAAPPPPPPPPPPPLKVQLLGIVREGEAYKAVLYDPDTDTLRVVGAGDELGGRRTGDGPRVERVTGDSVSIKTGVIVQKLALRAPGATP